jgi:predicted Zn-dependent protease with MMP-like domain
MAGMSRDWQSATAPTLAEFEAIAARAWDKIPAEFRTLAQDLIIRIEDFAPDDVLESLGIEDPFELTGLYQGVSIDKHSVADSARDPDIVFLYRRPILDEWAAGEEELGHLIAHVLVHEIGHHFGFSDEDMEAVEDAAQA